MRQKNIYAKWLGLIVLSIFSFQFSICQAQEVIDEVVWVVGDEAILRSEVEDERLSREPTGHLDHHQG